MIFNSPLEQFEVVIFFAINFLGLFKVVILNVSYYLGLSFFLIWSLTYLSMWLIEGKLIASGWQVIIEIIFNFVMSIVKEQLGRQGMKYFPMLFLIFVFIVSANLIGLIPYSFTVTSHIIITFLMALSFNISFILLGFKTHGIKFLKLFVPSGIKGILLPLIVIIEVFSYLIRSISLSVRLFANMLAGHTSIHLILTFAVTVLKSKFYIIVILPLIFFIAIYALEFVIAIVQAYVFILLLCIYLNESLNLH